MPALKVLAVAVATGRVGYVFFDGSKLIDWGLSRTAGQSRKTAVAKVETWIGYLKPDVVITEDVVNYSRKGAKSKRIIAAIADLAANQSVSDITLQRVRSFDNKYEEAKALAERFPDLLPWLPKRPRLWESEPRNMVYFEATSLALQVIDQTELKT